VKLLLDTQLLIWVAGVSQRLSTTVLALLDDPHNELLFSAASIWEIAIKSALRRDQVELDPRVLRRRLLDNGYAELPVTSQHAVTIDSLPLLHKDPFDRLLLAQAISEGIVLLTADTQLARYPGPVRLV
jgi:PIN domain nuclease of toxin-antitoxin system